MMFRIGVKFGMLLSGFMAISHSLEVFANLQPPLPAVRGVAMWALMFVVCGAASAVTCDRAKAVSLGIGASVVAAVIGSINLVVFAVAIGALRRQPLTMDTIVSTGGVHIGGAVGVGLAVGFVSSQAAAFLRTAPKPLAVAVSAGALLLLGAGLTAIVVATSMARSARPPFIMFGLPAMATALAVVSPAALAVFKPPIVPRARAS
jgi:hypothetical protein